MALVFGISGRDEKSFVIEHNGEMLEVHVRKISNQLRISFEGNLSFKISKVDNGKKNKLDSSDKKTIRVKSL